MLDSQFVGWVTGLIIPSSESFLGSSFTQSNFATGTRHVGPCTGVTEGSSSIYRYTGVPRGFPCPGLNRLAYCREMPSAISIPSGEVFVEFEESRAPPCLFCLGKSSNTPEPAYPFCWEVVVCRLGRPPQRNLLSVVCLFCRKQGSPDLLVALFGFHMCWFCFWSLNEGITDLINCWAWCCKLQLSQFVLSQFSISRREQGVNERRTSLHT